MESQSLLDNEDPYFTADAQRLCPNDLSGEDDKADEDENKEERKVDEEKNEEIMIVKIPTVDIADMSQEQETEPPCVSTPKEGHNLRDRDLLRPPPTFSEIATISQVEKAVGPLED